jgi:hypothetical protein
MSDRKYTIVCEFRGGTYVSQVSATDEHGAIDAWTSYLVCNQPIPRVSKHLAKAVAARISETAPIALDGLTGVWCVSAACGGDLMLANIVHTASEADGS